MTTEKALLQALLEAPERLEWSLQGLGMLRTYLGTEKRLHVWHSGYAVEGVSQMHTHPWHMESKILAGVVRQNRYMRPGMMTKAMLESEPPEEFMQQSLKCGVGGHLTEAPEQVWLRKGKLEEYGEGDVYRQFANEIHVSLPEDGTITVISRSIPQGANPDLAYVFWPAGEEWVSAEPRPATDDERDEIIGYALERWFYGD